jgi:putative transcriptional regulator
MLYIIATAVNRAFSKRCKLYMPRVKVESMPIKWRLAVLMADREVDYKQLANMTGMHQVTVSKHKNMRVMPERLERETLEKYCKALNCQPGELLVYMPDKDLEEKRS